MPGASSLLPAEVQKVHSRSRFVAESALFEAGRVTISRRTMRRATVPGKMRIKLVAFPVAVSLLAILPVVLLLSSIRTLRELEAEREVFLRSRAANVISLLSALPSDLPEKAIFEYVSAGEPALVDLRIFSQNQPGQTDTSLAPLWSGRELFREMTLERPEGRIFRIEAPFNSRTGLRIARIDLDASSADFLIVHARHNVLISMLSGLALVVLSLYAIFAARRAARLRLLHAELEHLAHLGQMASVLAHEIRNPLGAVKGFIQLAAEQPDDTVRELLAPATGEVERIERLINDLLLYGRPPSPKLRPVKWTELLARLESHVERIRQGRPVRFAADACELEWKTDPDILEHILLNLIRNAIEATAGQLDASVRLSVEHAPGGSLTLRVADNGPGLPAEVRERLFQPFLTTKSSGTGLGLAIARSLARSLGGDLFFKHAQPHGTAALVTFSRTEVISGGQNNGK